MKNKKSWKTHPTIKHPYGIRELLLDIAIGAQAGLIFTLAFVVKPETSDYIIIPLVGAYIAGAIHYTITAERNRSLYNQNKEKRSAQRGA